MNREKIVFWFSRLSFMAASLFSFSMCVVFLLWTFYDYMVPLTIMYTIGGLGVVGVLGCIISLEL